jgi:predicted DNA-binding protein with PD1-like motif
MQVVNLEGLRWFHLTLDAGAMLHQSLRDFLKQQGLRHAFVLSCIGSCTKVVAVFPKTKEIPPELGRVEYEGLFEMNGIAGDVRRLENEIKVHLHGSLTKEGREVFGGAIQEGTQIFKTAELVIAGLA